MNKQMDSSVRKKILMQIE